jgi:pyruvate dehydrogenase E1 component
MTDHSITRFLAAQGADLDPAETAEWRDAFLAWWPPRARSVPASCSTRWCAWPTPRQVSWQPELVTPYVNTIAVDQQPPFPGDLAIEEKLASLMRWNALAMVAKANTGPHASLWGRPGGSGAYGELGGHIASYASAADLFEVGFNHFFHARNVEAGGALGVLPAAQRARRLCPRLSGRAAHRG